MNDSGKESHKLPRIDQFKKLLDVVYRFVDTAPEEEKQEVLILLKESKLFALLANLQAEEKRRHARKLCAIDIDGASWRGRFNGMVQNISPGGMFIETDTTLSLREEITVSFFFANTPEPIRVGGEVVWTPRRGIGVRFTSPLSKKLQEVIESL